MTEPKRLLRLADAQGALAQVLEARLLAAERDIAALEKSAAERAAAVEGLGAAAMTFRSAALRGMAEVLEAIAAEHRNVAALRGSLVVARTRETSLRARASAAIAVATRRKGEAEALETALAMTATGSGKHPVVD